MPDKYREVLEEVLYNLRQTQMINNADSYIDDSIQIISKALKEENVE